MTSTARHLFAPLHRRAAAAADAEHRPAGPRRAPDRLVRRRGRRLRRLRRRARAGGPLLGPDRRPPRPDAGARRVRAGLRCRARRDRRAAGRPSTPALVVPAAVLGLAVPPVGECWRALLPSLARPVRVRRRCHGIRADLRRRPAARPDGRRRVVDRHRARRRRRRARRRHRRVRRAPRLAGAGGRPSARTPAARCGPAACASSSSLMLAVGVVFGATEVGVTAAAARRPRRPGARHLGRRLADRRPARAPAAACRCRSSSARWPPGTWRWRSPPAASSRSPSSSPSPARPSPRPTRSSTRWSSSWRPPGRSPRRSPGCPPRPPSAPPPAPRWPAAVVDAAGPVPVFALAGVAGVAATLIAAAD